MHSRFSRLIGVLTLTLVLAGLALPSVTPAQAQDYCALTPEECELFTAAMAEQDNTTSLNIDTLNITMLATVDNESIGIEVINMNGPVAYYRNQLDFDAAWAVETVTVKTPDTAGELSLAGLEIRVVNGMIYIYNPLEDLWEEDVLELGELSGLLGNSPMSTSNNEFVIAPTNDVWSADMVTWTTGPDNLNGTDVVKFTADVQMGDMVSNRDFMLNVGEVLETASDGEFTAELFQFLMGGFALQIEDELNAGTFAISYYISPEDNQVYGFDLVLDMTLDLGFLAGLADDMEFEVLSLNLAMNAIIGGHNATYEIAPPPVE